MGFALIGSDPQLLLPKTGLKLNFSCFQVHVLSFPPL